MTPDLPGCTSRGGSNGGTGVEGVKRNEKNEVGVTGGTTKSFVWSE